jgi:hypothetical protein
MKKSLTIILLLLISHISLSNEYKLKLIDRLKTTGLSDVQAETTTKLISKGYSETIDFLANENINKSNPELIGVWKWIVSRRVNDSASDTAYWLAYSNYERNDWLRLLGHPSPKIVYQAIKHIANNNDVDAIPTLIGLLNRSDITGVEVLEGIYVTSASALLKLTHNPISLPKWEDKKDIERVKKAWRHWYSENAGKPQKDWIIAGDAKITEMLESDTIEDAFAGFVIAKRLNIYNKQCEMTLKKYKGKLRAELSNNKEGEFIYKITNVGKDAIVAFKRNTYFIRRERGGSASSCSPYFPKWHYSMILRKGESWQTLISAKGNILSCTIEELLREINYTVTLIKTVEPEDALNSDTATAESE